jgi:hypothetical protein
MLPELPLPPQPAKPNNTIVVAPITIFAIELFTPLPPAGAQVFPDAGAIPAQNY